MKKCADTFIKEIEYELADMIPTATEEEAEEMVNEFINNPKNKKIIEPIINNNKTKLYQQGFKAGSNLSKAKMLLIWLIGFGFFGLLYYIFVILGW